MTIALFVIAGAMLVFVVVVAPSVVKAHLAWKAWSRFPAKFPDFEAQFRALSEVLASLGVVAVAAFESMRALADVLEVDSSEGL